ncbi:MAG: GDSL-type esterase/lipase family protein [Luteolibacter sp.]|jgi:acyl-CoA thioesterase-1|nr:GDSL-type esterase/lipase family protein [Luteolibacter sp.]
MRKPPGIIKKITSMWLLPLVMGAADPAAPQTVTIVGFGNSITEARIQMPDEKQRWLHLLNAKLTEAFPAVTFNVINSGIGGDSTREAMARFDQAVSAHQPDWVILELGGNNEDLAHPARIVSPEEFKTLLARYLEKLPSKTKTLVVTFPPILDDLHAYGRNPAFTAHYQKTGGIDKSVDPYREISRSFARTHGFPLYDLHKELLSLGRKHGRMTYTLADGIHLTREGNAVLADGIFKILSEQRLKSDR